MGDFAGIHFSKQVLPSKGLGAITERMLTDGVLLGMGVSYSGTGLTVAAGYCCIKGRVAQLAAAKTYTVDGATSGFARLLLAIDLTATATPDTFEQIEATVEYSATEAGFAALTQDSINMAGTEYEHELVRVALGAAGVTGIVSGPAKARPAQSPSRPVKLWAGTWSAGTRIVKAAGGSTGCTGAGNVSDWQVLLIITEGMGIVCTVGSGIHGSLAWTDPSSEFRTQVVQLTISGDTLTYGRVDDWAYTGGTMTIYRTARPITAIYGLVRKDDILTA